MGSPAAELQSHNTGETVVVLCINKNVRIFIQNSTDNVASNLSEICFSPHGVFLTLKLPFNSNTERQLSFSLSAHAFTQ